MRDPEQLIRTLEMAGYRLWIDGPLLRVKPKPDARALALLKPERDAVYHFVKRCGRHPGERVGGVELEALREYCPKLFEVIRAPDAREALLWGVTAHGLILSYEPSGTLYTVKP